MPIPIHSISFDFDPAEAHSVQFEVWGRVLEEEREKERETPSS